MPVAATLGAVRRRGRCRLLPPTPANLLLIVVEELASVGHEQWLRGTGPGVRVCADRRWLGTGQGTRGPSPTDRLTHDLLRALVTPDIAHDQLAARCPPATAGPFGMSRATTRASPPPVRSANWRLALDHLWAQSLDRLSHFPILPGAPYGRSLSMPKVHAVHELYLGMSGQAVSGDDAHGWCFTKTIACSAASAPAAVRNARSPRRHAIWPIRAAPPAGRAIRRPPPFCCIACGKPFATRRA